MANIITAGNSTNGGTQINTDTSGTLDIKTGTGSGTTAISVNASQATTFAAGISGTTGSFSGNMSFNSGYGSAAVAYACRAWVNFNGSGTVAIRASGNVSSITDNGVGNYTANFSTAMPDVNYAATAINDLTSNGAWYVNPYIYAYNTTSVQYLNASSYTPNLNPADCVLISITVFR
ncbi:hypothetical protein UFOVP684_54 [uncultured Caudovirales phage]|uniref:Uncharacterized protein n=1 Tax=uncultured Caudovirales phage TaxID=2100421 RepID=A0A6J5M525_9CAUD|nr:hypothetical protein UFOVP409_48 [uncultured Caudovirales phage]CAB4157919.1 hypothetical protein UFOVP684_54 [uncultured Caudovirales phage]